jgi:hypothetical protein
MPYAPSPMPFALWMSRCPRMNLRYAAVFFNKPNFKENIDMCLFSVYKVYKANDLF